MHTTNRYPDLVTSTDDAALSRLIEDLDGALTPPPLPAEVHASVGRAIAWHAASASTPPSTRTGRARRWRRPVIVGAVLMAALLSVLGAAAASGDPPTTLVDQAMVYAPGQQQVMQRYGHAVSAIAHACGYTLHVRRAYADVNRLSILYTIDGPAGRRFLSVMDMWPTVTAGAGSVLRNLDLGLSRDTIGSMEGRYAAYNVSQIAPRARSLRLRLSIPALTMTEVAHPLGLGAAATACETYQPGPTYALGPGIPVLGGIPFLGRLFPGFSQIYPTRVVTVHKPLSVSFTVPVDPARHVITPHQTLRAGGQALTLAKVVVTRSETRVYLQRTTRGHILEGVQLGMLVGGRRYGDGIPLFHDWWQNNAPAARLYDFWFVGPSLMRPGTWRLDVVSDPNLRATPRGFPGGPWSFLIHVGR